ncbi:MAG: hypothetical protein ACLSHC_00070 [Bilophila wadsworthia]
MKVGIIRCQQTEDLCRERATSPQSKRSPARSKRWVTAPSSVL